MKERDDHLNESFRRNFHPREFEDVCVLVLAADLNSGVSDGVSLLTAGVESMLHAGIGGFVFDLTQFSRRTDREESLGYLVRCMVPALRSGAALSWLHGSVFVQEWKRLKLLGVPPANFESEQQAVEHLQTLLKAARIRTDLAQRILKSGVSFKAIANVAGLIENDVRRIAEGLEEPPDRVAVLISSTLDSLEGQTSSPENAHGGRLTKAIDRPVR